MNIDEKVNGMVTDLAALIGSRHPDLVQEISRLQIEDNPRDFFLWAQKKSESCMFDEAIENKLTDLFYLLR